MGSAAAPAVSFVVPGPPQGKARPRMGAHGNVYTPAKTRAYEATIKLLALQALARAKWPLGARKATAIELQVVAESGARRDIDNVAKAVLDAMNGVAYDDDARVHELHVFRSVDAARPRVEVRLWRLA